MYSFRYLANIIFFAIFLLLCSNATAEQPSLESTLAQSNDSNQRALSLLRELYSIEESIIYPQNDQLELQMSQQNGATVLLERVDVYIDNKLIVSHQIEMADLEVLMNRGVFRLTARLVPPGEHVIDVEIFSFMQVPVKNRFTFNKQPYPQFISLSLNRDQMALDDWTNE